MKDWFQSVRGGCTVAECQCSEYVRPMKAHPCETCGHNPQSHVHIREDQELNKRKTTDKNKKKARSRTHGDYGYGKISVNHKATCNMMTRAVEVCFQRENGSLLKIDGLSRHMITPLRSTILSLRIASCSKAGCTKGMILKNRDGPELEAKPSLIELPRMVYFRRLRDDHDEAANEMNRKKEIKQSHGLETEDVLTKYMLRMTEHNEIQMEADIIFGHGNVGAENLFAKHGRRSPADKMGRFPTVPGMRNDERV